MDNNISQNNISQEKPSVWVANPRLKTLLLILIFVFLFSGIGLAAIPILQNQYRQKIYEQTQAGLPKHQVNQAPTKLTDGRLQVGSPKEGDTVGQTFSVSGYAQNWFEGNIVIKVFDASNTPLYSGNAIAGDNYDHPAPFTSTITLTATSTTPTGRIEFNDYSAKDGGLVYQKVVRVNFANFDDISGWKIYKNDQYGFELSYPGNWKLIACPLSDNSPSALVYFNPIETDPCNKDTAALAFINIYSNNTNRGNYYDMIINNNRINGKNSENYQEQDIIVSGTPAKKFLWGGSTYSTSEDISFMYQNYTFEIGTGRIGHFEGSQELLQEDSLNRSEFEKMASTFKFTK